MRFVLAGTQFAIAGDWYVLDDEGRKAAFRGKRLTVRSVDGTKVAIISPEDLETLPRRGHLMYVTWSGTFRLHGANVPKHMRGRVCKAGVLGHYSLVDAMRHLRTHPADTRGISYLWADWEVSK